MFLPLLRYFKGTVDFYAEGADAESFYTFCSKNGIEIISPQKNGYGFFAKTEAKNYKKLKKPAKKYGIKLKLIKKQGFCFFVKNNRIKIGFVFGFVFTFMFTVLMNLFVWEINVIGNQNTPTENIIKSAEEMGLFTGTFSKNHFVQDIEWYIFRENPGLASVEINIQGSVANILINERKTETEMVPDDDVPINLVASKYGVIEKMNVYDGKEVVKPGDAVLKGDLLVSAVYEDSHNKLTLKHARADIIAKTDYNIKVEFPLKKTIIEKDKIKKKTYKIRFLGKDFLIGNSKNCEDFPFEKKSKQLYFFGIKLPISIIKTTYFNVKENTITYSFEDGKTEAYSILSKKEKTEMKEMEILSRKTTEIIKNEKYMIEADYIVLMNIAKEQPIDSDVPWENTDDMS
ncbi:MAG: sporulation protein YqfD [Oscillospiraceae bacterium]|nr:sporulation protein YqfD [Oscillospiraceae bacterium]